VKRNLRGAAAENTDEFKHADGANGDERHGRLHAAAGADAEAVDGSEKREGGCGDEGIIDGPLREFEEVAGEGDRDGGHAPGLDDEKQHPTIEKCDARMEGFAKVSVLAADYGQARGEFRVNEAAEKSDEAAGNPNGQDEEGSVDAFGDEIRIDENARADDAAHYGHGGTEKAEMAREASARRELRGWVFWRTHEVWLNWRSRLGQFVEILDLRERGAVYTLHFGIAGFDDVVLVGRVGAVAMA